ncbi:MAG: hypothetical protein H6557_17400 [Lewinellaceae bacterium]|nr:hypothetical protein [Phaeodactylibacter sp.]MCB9038394.1 hypothetical protein [Lewinellaceae bacterium]
MPHTAILRHPASTFASGITTANLGQPDYEKALEQHRAYCAALRQCGLQLILLDPDERYPDGCFVEDTAIVTEELVILCRPGAASRRGEVAAVAEVLAEYRPLATIKPPGTVDGGDILRVDNHFYIGRSERTNAEGARQLAGILSEGGFTSSEIPVRSVLHLKTGVTYIGKNTFVVIDEFAGRFPSGQVIRVEEEEAYAVNCLLANGTVLAPAGFPKVKRQIAELGCPIIEVEMSEFRKIDGGLTCLSLVF